MLSEQNWYNKIYWVLCYLMAHRSAETYLMALQICDNFLQLLLL